ncbi:MAG: DUF1559 domain-containing protein, partial [Maioricimonas sp. JB045]
LPAFICPSDTAPEQINRGAAADMGSIRSPGQAYASYKASMGSYDNFGSGNRDLGNGMFRRMRNNGNSSRRMRDILDGTTNTIMVGETWHRIHAGGRLYGGFNSVRAEAGASNDLMRHGQYKMNPPEGIPNATGLRSESFHSAHEGGVHFLMGDGSVRFISENIEHTAHAWTNNANRYDLPNNGAGYGLYQRLFSIWDNMVVSEF